MIRALMGISLGCWIALAALQVLWHGVVAPPEHAPAGIVVTLFLIPLLLPALSLKRGLRRALFFAALVAMLYFSHGVTELAGTSPARPLAWLEVFLSAGMVIAYGTVGRIEKRRRQR